MGMSCRALPKAPTLRSGMNASLSGSPFCGSLFACQRVSWWYVEWGMTQLNLVILDFSFVLRMAVVAQALLEKTKQLAQRVHSIVPKRKDYN